MGEHGRGAAVRSNFLDESIDASADLRGVLAVEGEAVPKDQPRRSRSADLPRRESFIGAVAPLDQIGFDVRMLSESSELAGHASPLERTRHDGSGATSSTSCTPEPPGGLAAAFGKRYV